MATMYAGIDVDKTSLVLYLDGTLSQWKNTPEGCRNMLKNITKKQDVHVVCESTGGLEQLLANACHEADLPVTVAFPSRIRHYAKACGQWAKTDQIDAQMIARWGSATTPAADHKPSPEQQRLRQLVSRRQQLIEEITRQKQQVEGYQVIEIRRGVQATIAQLQREKDIIEELLAELAESLSYAAKVKALSEVEGVGQTTALAVLAHLPEIGQLNRREVAMIAGVAPFNKDSGRSVGKRRIYGGRPALRKAIFMAALCASRHNPVLSVHYRHLLRQGKEKKVALVAIMRKLLIYMNIVLKKLPTTPKTT